jgi:signal transduction histidine kinase
MPEGGYLIIEVTDLAADRLPIDPEGPARHEHVMRISFQDSGCGMDSSVMQHLFEPFFTTKGPTGEHGLGLASVHGAVKRHKGWMQVESTPGKGSTFRIFLPWSSASSAASAA